MQGVQGKAARVSLTSGVLALSGLLFVLIMVVHWGGSVVTGVGFVVGVAVVIGLIALFALAAWWLLLSPLPNKRVVKMSTAFIGTRQLMVVAVLIGGILLTLGGFWDEVWHRLYGIGGIIDDFWWRPHLLIYGSLAIIAASAFVGFFTVVLRGKGSLRARFRAEPLLGMLMLAAGFQMVFAPLDPLWHQLYGLDLTAWSLPHVLFGVSFALISIAALSMQLSLMPHRPWRFLTHIRPQDILLLLLLMNMLINISQIGTTEWEALTRINGDSSFGFWNRPEWLYPVVLTTLATFVGVIAARTTRIIGAASLVGLLTLAFRAVTISIFNAGAPEIGVSFQAQILMLPPLIALDLWHVLIARSGKLDHVLAVWGAGVASAFGVLIVSVPLIPQFTVFPRVNGETIPGFILFSVLMGLGTAWMAAQIARFVMRYQPQTDAEALSADANARRALLIGVGLLTAALAFVVFFIVTATPPVV
ncbi:MAG: hypothetical protein U0670_03600 [Anaerolineae bacterium]